MTKVLNYFFNLNVFFNICELFISFYPLVVITNPAIYP